MKKSEMKKTLDVLGKKFAKISRKKVKSRINDDDEQTILEFLIPISEDSDICELEDKIQDIVDETLDKVDVEIDTDNDNQIGVMIRILE